MNEHSNSFNEGFVFLGEFVDNALTGESTTIPPDQPATGRLPEVLKNELQRLEKTAELQAHRELLGRLLRKRLGELPGPLWQRIAAADLDTLQNALDDVLCGKPVEELKL
jgi:hypothetical protein